MTRLVVALPKGRIQKDSMALFEAAGYGCPEMFSGSRKLVFDAPDAPLRFMVVRATDVPTYVYHGAADLGICGLDTLEESGLDLLRPLDLGFGGCDMCVAEPAGLSERSPGYNGTTVATKFVNLAERFFAARGVDVEIIKLYGSIELAPLMGLADRIVDIVETGETLRQNGLVVHERIFHSSCHLVVNRRSMKICAGAIADLIGRLRAQLEASTA